MITTRANLNDGGNVLDVLLNRGQEFIETKIDEWLPSGTPVNTTVSQSEANRGNQQIIGQTLDQYRNSPSTLPTNFFESGTYNLPPSSTSSGGVNMQPRSQVTYAKAKGVDVFFDERTTYVRDFDCNQLQTLTDAQKRWLESNPLVYQKIQAVCTDRIITPSNTWFGIAPMWYFVVGALLLLFFSIPKRSDK